MIPVINGKESLQCTCTLAWLLQNTTFSTQTNSVRSCFDVGPTISIDLIRNCTFASRVNECNRLRQPTTLITTRNTATSSPPATIVIKEPKKDSTTSIVFGVIGIVVVLIVGALAGFYIWRKWSNKNKSTNKKQNQNVNDDSEYINIIKVK